MHTDILPTNPDSTYIEIMIALLVIKEELQNIRNELQKCIRKE
jgi:hypothetical protein